MKILSDLRAVALLRRIARAAELQADALDELRRIERDRWQRETRTTGRPARKTEIDSFDIEAANERWRKEQEALSVGATLEDITNE